MAKNQSNKFSFLTGRNIELISYGLIALAVIVFFADGLFTGKNFLSDGDNVAFYSFVPYLDAAKESGEFPLWVPYIFSGMPSLASFLAAGERSWDVIGMLIFSVPRMLGDLFNNDTARLAMWYIIYGWGVYTLMRVKKFTPAIGVFCATAAIFSTFVIIWIMIGHSTKPVSLSTLPWLLLALERIREKFSWTNLFLLILPLIVLVTATHPQMMFYMGCAATLYLLVELITRVVTKDNPKSVLIAGGSLAFAALIALGTHADMFMSTREYTQYSTRGSAPLVQSEKNTQDQTGGNDYEYATNWSFSPSEVMTFFVPNFYGFGNTAIKPAGAAKEQRTNLYWGQMPFTDAANYMGIGVLMLALVGAWHYRRDPFVIFLVVLGLFSLFLSFGKNLSFLYDAFFNLVPSFNKFRAPSMALVLLQFATPVLAGYGIAAVLEWAEKLTDQSKKRANIFAGSAVAFLIIGFAYVNVNEANYKSDVAEAVAVKNPQQVKSAADVSPQYLEIVFTEMKSDWMVTGFIAVLFGALVFFTVRGKISPSIAIAMLIGLTLIDLWRVDKRGYEPKKGSPEQNVFRKTDAVDFIKNDNGVFRIADLSNALPANWWAYHFIENVHGYSSAKLRVYQDMLDVAGPGAGRDAVPGNSTVANPFLWDLLNVKYIVSAQPIYQGVPPDFTSQNGLMIYENRTVLPRAWFVDSVKVESDKMKLLHMLRDGTFNPRSVAFVETATGANTQPLTGESKVKITGKSNQKLSFDVSTTASSFLVVSEVYYPEWHAYIDGQEVTTHKTDFLLRGLVVPAGKHTVEFRYQSDAFQQGRLISMASNSITALVGLMALFVWSRKRSKKGVVA
ncbi:MAG: YfhO family protein [Ignavibacteria bacterium]|nr:YfhO family protein [Ignavibacteria bacterium]